MTELSVQEKLLKLQQMGKMPFDNTPTLGEYLQLAMELADCKTKISGALKVLENCCDKDECCIFTDDGVCYDDECLIAEAKTILGSSASITQKNINEVSK
jgi:hypothetical protein